MGDPRKQKKKFSGPRHPWQAARIEEEAGIIGEYALKNKTELWKAFSLIKKFKSKAKELIASETEQARIEEKQLLTKLIKLKIISENSKVEDILDISISSVLERRLQTQVYKKGLARTTKQARQFITHSHITIKNSAVTIPSYLVSSDDEGHIEFAKSSKLSNSEHPERKIEKKEVKFKKISMESKEKPTEEKDTGILKESKEIKIKESSDEIDNEDKNVREIIA